jgi:hypothetical protein
MITPGFTAEASLGRPSRTHSHTPRVLSAPAEQVELAQLGTRVPVLPFPVQPAPAAQPLPAGGLQVYGNWCGPGHSGPGAPIDPVDQVCCRHDKCYSKNGSLDCKCDRDLVAGMPRAIADSRTPARGRAVGAAAMALFSVTPCICHKACVPFFGCHDLPGGAGVPGIPGLKLCPPGTA